MINYPSICPMHLKNLTALKFCFWPFLVILGYLSYKVNRFNFSKRICPFVNLCPQCQIFPVYSITIVIGILTRGHRMHMDSSGFWEAPLYNQIAMENILQCQPLDSGIKKIVGRHVLFTYHTLPDAKAYRFTSISWKAENRITTIRIHSCVLGGGKLIPWSTSCPNFLKSREAMKIE